MDQVDRTALEHLVGEMTGYSSTGEPWSEVSGATSGRRVSRRAFLSRGLEIGGIAAGLSMLGRTPFAAAAARPLASTRKFRIALANSYIGNVWRIEMENLLKAAVQMEPYKSQVELTIFNAPNTSVSAQESQMTDMIASKYDAILLDAASGSGLNGVIEQATRRGILVVSYDNVVTAPSAAKVNINQYFFGRTWAQFLANKLHGHGNVIMVTGVAGASANAQRNAGAAQVWQKYPGIKIVSRYTGEWDSAVAQKNTISVLPSLPKIDGIWCQGGTDGVLNAFKAAGRPLPYTAGEAENGFRLYMAGYLKPRVDGVSIGQPPYNGVVALELARRLLLKVPGTPRNITLLPPVIYSDQVKLGVSAFPNLPHSFFDDFTGTGPNATVVFSVNSALHGTPSGSYLKVNL
jgi:ribose transport system substrate-binding protein